MVVGRERFTPRADVRGVSTIVAVGLGMLGVAAAVVAGVVAVLRLAGVGA